MMNEVDSCGPNLKAARVLLTRARSRSQLTILRSLLRSRSSSMEKSATSGVDVGGLESSLLRIVQGHHQSALQIRQQTEKAKNDALRSAVRVSELLVDTVNSGVEASFINEKRIELEIRALASTVMRYTKQTNQWLSVSHALNTALKEIGDFENWMKTMEYDCKSISAALCNIHQA